MATVNIFIVFQSCIGIERSQQPAPDCQANSGSSLSVNSRIKSGVLDIGFICQQHFLSRRALGNDERRTQREPTLRTLQAP